MGQPVCRLEVAMEPHWKERIERYAWLHGMRQNAVVVEAIRRYFERLEESGETAETMPAV
ncbi:MAG: hypothetical protein K6U14_11125 [Firmicutes bacterium]|nr:hypothetical protein [Alicyclobacillaceae bacterium]MCL6498164.1 hypothetical protein [Bacillota bacterium]